MLNYEVFDSLFDSVIVIDGDRKIVYCNEPAAALAGSSVRRLTKGIEFSSVIHLDDVGLFPADGGEIGRAQPAPMREIRFHSQDGVRKGKLQVTVQPFHDEGSSRWVVVMHDVTLEETLHVKYQGELEQKEGYIRELKSAKDQLELYSKNLEKMVEERTAEVRHANRLLNAIMESLGQGFLVFNRDGVCLPVFTKACEEILETLPAGRSILDVLRLSGGDHDAFKKWLVVAFDEALPFDSMIDLAPQRYHHSQGKYVTLAYYPIRSAEGEIENIVLVATDKSKEHEAQVALAKEQQYIQMVMKILKNREQFGQFLKSARESIQILKIELNRNQSNFNHQEAYRILHTLEGECGLFSALTVWQSARHCQEILEPFKRSVGADLLKNFAQIKVAVAELEETLDAFMRDNRELLEVLRVGSARNIEIALPVLQEFSQLLVKKSCPQEVRDRFTEDLLKQPMSQFLKHFEEVARQVAQAQGKMLRQIEFDCDRVRVAPGALDGLFASLVHAFRNAVDHGIELPESRVSKGKAEAGRIRVMAESFRKKADSWIRIEISDDGQGIEPDVIRQKLKKKFPNEDFGTQSDREVIQAIFRPGFSSRDAVGEFSGRGIGMDAIKTEVELLQGQVSVQSDLGKGSRLILEFPNPGQSEAIAMSA